MTEPARNAEYVRCGIEACPRLACWEQTDFPEYGLTLALCNFHAEPFMTGREYGSRKASGREGS